MIISTTDPPGAARAGRHADPPADRDERRIRAIVDALRRAVGPGGVVDEPGRAALLHALFDDVEVAADGPDAPHRR